MEIILGILMLSGFFYLVWKGATYRPPEWFVDHEINSELAERPAELVTTIPIYPRHAWHDSAVAAYVKLWGGTKREATQWARSCPLQPSDFTNENNYLNAIVRRSLAERRQ